MLGVDTHRCDRCGLLAQHRHEHQGIRDASPAEKEVYLREADGMQTTKNHSMSTATLVHIEWWVMELSEVEALLVGIPPSRVSRDADPQRAQT